VFLLYRLRSLVSYRFVNVCRLSALPFFQQPCLLSDHHAQSAKKELKDLSMQKAVTTTTTTTTTTAAATPKSTTNEDANINRNKTHNLNNVLTTTTTEKSRSKPEVTVDEQDFVTSKSMDQSSSTIGTSLVVGLVCALVLLTVLVSMLIKAFFSPLRYSVLRHSA
jgi:hypothetical protein